MPDILKATSAKGHAALRFPFSILKPQLEFLSATPKPVVEQLSPMNQLHWKPYNNRGTREGQWRERETLKITSNS